MHAGAFTILEAPCLTRFSPPARRGRPPDLARDERDARRRPRTTLPAPARGLRGGGRVRGQGRKSLPAAGRGRRPARRRVRSRRAGSRHAPIPSSSASCRPCCPRASIGSRRRPPTRARHPRLAARRLPLRRATASRAAKRGAPVVAGRRRRRRGLAHRRGGRLRPRPRQHARQRSRPRRDRRRRRATSPSGTARRSRASSATIFCARNFPMIHAVGRASRDGRRGSSTSPGARQARRSVTLVGKGVAFDTGGLDIKPACAMLLMKKDMGGAAAALALADMIDGRGPADPPARPHPRRRERRSPARPSGPATSCRAARASRVEIGNTDAEGRLILADALALADEESARPPRRLRHPDRRRPRGARPGPAALLHRGRRARRRPRALRPRPSTIPSGACRCGRPTRALLEFEDRRHQPHLGRPVRRLDHRRPVPAPLRRPPRRRTSISTSSPGTRRPSPAGPKAARCRARGLVYALLKERYAQALMAAARIRLPRRNVSMTFDRRITPAPPRPRRRALARPGRGRALHGRDRRCASSPPSAPLRRHPSPDAPARHRGADGRAVTVYDEHEGWAWGQLARGRLCRLPAERRRSARSGAEPTHRVARPAHLRLSRPELKLPPRGFSQPRRARRGRRASEGDYAAPRDRRLRLRRPSRDVDDARARLRRRRRALRRHALSLGRQDEPRPRLLRPRPARARRRRHRRRRATATCRSARSATPSRSRPDLAGLRRGDLVFWKGHVGIMLDGERLLHANGHHMAVAVEPLRAAGRSASGRRASGRSRASGGCHALAAAGRVGDRVDKPELRAGRGRGAAVTCVQPSSARPFDDAGSPSSARARGPVRGWPSRSSARRSRSPSP